MPTFDDPRYNALISSGFETAYWDEMEKMGFLQPLGQGVARVLPWAAKLLPRSAAVAGKATTGAAAAGKASGPGLLGRFAIRQKHALGLGGKYTPAQLQQAGVRGAVPKTQAQIEGEAIKKVREGWIPRAKKFIMGKKYDEAAEIKRLAGRMGKEEAAAAKLYEMGATSLPGAAKAMVTQPGQLMGAGWKSMPRWQKYMMGGFGAMQAKELAEMEGKTPQEKAETLARSAALAPLWLGTGGVAGMLVPMAAWTAGEEGAVAGAKALARKMHPNAPATSAPQLGPEEIEYMRQMAPEGLNQ